MADRAGLGIHLRGDYFGANGGVGEAAGAVADIDVKPWPAGTSDSNAAAGVFAQQSLVFEVVIINGGWPG